jgi:hypothetical protein
LGFSRAAAGFHDGGVNDGPLLDYQTMAFELGAKHVEQFYVQAAF